MNASQVILHFITQVTSINMSKMVKFHEGREALMRNKLMADFLISKWKFIKTSKQLNEAERIAANQARSRKYYFK